MLVGSVDIPVDGGEVRVYDADGVADVRPVDDFASIELGLHVGVEFVEEPDHGH